MPGPLYFAWIDPGEAFNPAVHNRMDEDISSIEFEHDEGDFGMLTMNIRTSRTRGLLGPSRKRWAVLSYFSSVAMAIVCIYRGRVVGLSHDITKQTAAIDFVARPADFEAQKRALAETLRERPRYDHIFIDEKQRDNPDAVLVAYFSRWHIDHVTLEVTVSDGVSGEDGVEEFFEGEMPDAGLVQELGETPLTSVTIDATVTWVQRHKGSFSVGGGIDTFTGSGLVSGWPTPGAGIGDGYTAGNGSSASDAVVIGSITGGFKFEDKSEAKDLNFGAGHNDGDTLSAEMSYTLPTIGGSVIRPGANADMETSSTVGDPETGRAPSLSLRVNFTQNAMYAVSGTLVVDYDAKRDRTEHITITLTTNMQSLVSDPDGGNAEFITINGADVGQDIVRYDALTGVKTVAETMPIVDPIRRSFFPTPRGDEAIQYLVNYGVSRLLSRGRAVKITQECSFERAIRLTCRKNGLINDRRIDGNLALGKITRHTYSVNLDAGVMKGSVTIECVIGYGGAVVAADGSPVYISSDYIGHDYQRFDGNVIVLSAGNVGYSTPADVVNDDGLVFPLNAAQVLVFAGPTGATLEDQTAAVLAAAKPAPSISLNIANPVGAAIDHAKSISENNKIIDDQVKANEIWQRFEFRPVNSGPFENSFDLVTTPVELPKQIDLEAT